MPQDFSLYVNGERRAVATDSDRPLLDVLREDLDLTGVKYGCGEGECGACTVLLDGEPIRSCITSVGDVGESEILTIEGLADGDRLHPVQQAFLDKQAMQCGYCVPGQILAAVALLRETPQPSEEQIVAAMNGTLCRCCNYGRIRAAVAHAATIG